MSVYFHPFDVRWSDLDANFHLGNSVYVEYCAQARMAFMHQQGIGLQHLAINSIGPVILHEKYSFFKEIHHGNMVYVSVEINGMSVDGGMYQFLHRFYLEDGTHCATAEALGVWIDTKKRKSTLPSEEIKKVMLDYKTEHCITLTKDDLKKLPFRPENINPNFLKQAKCSN
ncbi:MAG: thioesterase family protein [Bacteroidetes bacterium]|nr:thioesterase family protein [Bacteroidota bacterium]